MQGSSLSQIAIGTAGWSIPALARDHFFLAGTIKPNHLHAYSSVLSGVEINSSFYRDHQRKTYERWRQSTPPEFRFSIKLAKRFTHEQKLEVDTSDLSEVLEGLTHLGEKLGVILVQIPPKLVFYSAVSEDFFASLRELYSGPVALEPRHESWATREATAVLEEFRIARVIADPDVIGEAHPIRSAGFSYFRLHGTPKVYYSEYHEDEIQGWATLVTEAAAESSDGKTWCIFDNTAMGYATINALQMLDKVKP